MKKKYPEGKNGKGRIIYADNPEKSLNGANVCFIYTEWEGIKSL